MMSFRRIKYDSEWNVLLFAIRSIKKKSDLEQLIGKSKIYYFDPISRNVQRIYLNLSA